MEIVIILVLIVLNGIFAMSELAIVSARKARLHQWASEGNTRARAALELANAPNHFLSTTQIGITLVGIFAGAFGGATLAAALAEPLKRVPWLAPYSQAISFGLVVLAITYLSLIIGELVPKRLALHSPERIAAAVAGPMMLLSRLAHPAVRLLSLSTDLVLRLLGLRPSAEPPVTEEEIQVLIRQGTQAGIFDEAEQEMVAGVFRLGERPIRAVMTPRTEILWLDVLDPSEETHRRLIESPFSRFPVCRESLDEILGIVQTRDLLALLLQGQPLDLQAALQKALYLHESASAAKALEVFKRTGIHAALVVDEYGIVQGLVTVTDILEEIVGELEPEEERAVRREDGSWLLDGMLSVDEFTEILGIDRLPGEEAAHFHTLGGFVMMQRGRVPVSGDHFEWGGLRFEVVDMDGNRVDKVLVTPAR